ncbi:MAG TPA: S-layer homology domain-containing protein, partial [Thermoanaerobaculia bacterium]
QNTSTSSRSANATIAGNSFNVNQAGTTAPTCTSFSISPASTSPSASSGSQLVTVAGSPSGCQGGSWSASGNGSWLTVSPSGGTGSGSVTVSWAQNTSTSSRSANATIASNSFSVNQAGTVSSSAILLVDDDDNNPDVESYYATALNALGKTYDVWDTGNSDNEPGAVALQAYKTVLWFTGHSYGGAAGPGASGEADLATFLSGGSGRCLVLSSQDYLFDRGVTSFMIDYLGLGGASSDVSQSLVLGQGSAFSGLGPYTLAYPFTNFSDVISPGTGAESAFAGDQGNAGISRIGPSHRTIFLGFPFEALPTAQARQEVMAAALDYCATIFADVPPKYWARKFIEALYRAGVTNGCAQSPLQYCPEDVVTRGSMAQMLIAAKDGPNYVPPPCTSNPFSDVPASSPICPWVQELVRRGVTAGCGGGLYCPNNPVTRSQMSVFLLSTWHGAGYSPAPCAGSAYNDVPSSSPFCPWIQEMAARGITAGCGGGAFCTESQNTRAQLAVFLATTFQLPLQ